MFLGIFRERDTEIALIFVFQLMRVNRLLKSRMKEPKAERELLPYLPDAMKRLLRAGLKMEDKAVEAAKNEMMSRPLDYVIIRLEEQLRGQSHTVSFCNTTQ